MGLGLLAFVAITVTWGDPFTMILEQGKQEELTKQLAQDTFGTDVGVRDIGGLPQPRITRRPARRFRHTLAKGDAAGRLQIPKIGLNKVVVNGAGVEPLKKGPGFYDQGAFPGMNLPVAIAGHRTTHGAPFLNIDKLKPGDPIYVTMPYGRFEYRVTRTRIITPQDWSILQFGAEWPRAKQLANPCPGNNCEHLVLTACHPKYSASQRLAVLAQLVKVTLPKGGAR
jgi:sortase A